MHGIGGAKYDQLTDAIIYRFFGFPAPAFVLATATAKLPLARPEIHCARLPELKQQIRRTVYQPERFVERTSETETLMQQKAHWVHASLPRGKRRQRHQEITRLNQALQPFVEQRRASLVEEHRGTLRTLPS